MRISDCSSDVCSSDLQINEVPSDMTAFVSAQQAARTAYTAAGIAPDDLDLAELYAPCTIVQVLVSEAMGLAPRGRGAAAAAAGETELGGRIPICTSGGCLSRGHPSYVTGLLTIYELWEQLTGRAGERQVKNRSEEHTSELQSLMRISYAVFCLKKKQDKYKYTKSNETNNKTK